MSEATGGPGDEIKSLGTKAVQAIAPQRKIKYTRIVKIPGYIAPGEYLLVAIVDPDGTSNDINPDNNRKVSKKLLIQ